MGTTGIPSTSPEGDVLHVQVAIVGAGPGGMVLAHLLDRMQISCVVLERRSRAYVEARVRAGVLEQTTCDVLARLGLAARLQREGLNHAGVDLVFDGQRIHIDLAQNDLAGITVYGQQEVMKDLYDAAAACGVDVRFEADGVTLHDVSDAPRVTWRERGQAMSLDCDFIVGCDGQHGVSRTSIPSTHIRTFERAYPFGWLGILADVPPVSEELVYCRHERGFALASMRSPSRSRYYLQCDADTRVEDWPDERFWDELALRLGPELGAQITRGPSIEKSIAPLRSSVSEPIRYGKLFLAGDAAHIVPPTGAKGLNLAVADVTLLADALDAHFRGEGSGALDAWSDAALAHVWQVERFSWWLTRLTHVFPDDDAFETRLQASEFRQLVHSAGARRAFAEHYVGSVMESE